MGSFATSPGARGIAGKMFGPLITYPAKNHSATVIMLHGLGDTGNGWASVAPELNLPHVRWLFPTAPTRPITVNGGMQMPGWFDIDHLDEESFVQMMQGTKGFDPEGTDESVAYVNSLIDAELNAGIPAGRIVVGGFSQGGHVALKTAIRHPTRLAACIALSTWLEPPPRTFKISDENLSMPMFYGHGSDDPLIPASIAHASLGVLAELGVQSMDFEMYPGMGHSACPKELQDMKKFLERVLPANGGVAPAQSIWGYLSEPTVRAMSAGELKKILAAKGISTAGMLEKSELVEKVLSLL